MSALQKHDRVELDSLHKKIDFKNITEENRYSTYTLLLNPLALELKHISKSVGYPFEIYYPDSDPEPFRIVANYFKQF